MNRRKWARDVEKTSSERSEFQYTDVYTPQSVESTLD